MGEFFSTMSGLERGFTLCAIVGGLLLFVRVVMMMVGGDVDADTDLDLHTDAIGDTDVDFRFVSVQGVMAFLLIFGLAGRAFLLGSPLGNFGSFIGATICGVLAMWGMGWAFVMMRRLQDSGNINLRDAIGHEGTVYLTIPEKGAGEVRVVFSGKMQVREGRSESGQTIETGTAVTVVDVVGDRTLIVTPAEKELNV